jgi:hypothetical protein
MLTVLIALGMVTYAAALHALNVVRARDLLAALRERR